MELLKTFGVNWVLLAAQVVNFVIVFFILKKLLYKPIFDTVKNREKQIKEGLKQAEDARILLEKTTEKEQEVLKKAQTEAKQMLTETRKQHDEIIKEAETIAKKQAQQILEEARKQIAFETREAQKHLSLQISGLAVEFLQKSAGELFSKEDQEAIVKNALKKLKKRVD